MEAYICALLRRCCLAAAVALVVLILGAATCAVYAGVAVYHCDTREEAEAATGLQAQGDVQAAFEYIRRECAMDPVQAEVLERLPGPVLPDGRPLDLLRIETPYGERWSWTLSRGERV